MCALTNRDAADLRNQISALPSSLEGRFNQGSDEITSAFNSLRLEDVATKAQARIDRIHKVWTTRPSRVTPSMCFKLVDAHFRMYASALKIPMAKELKYHATVDADHLESLKKSREMVKYDLTDSVIRWRLKDLEDQFGSAKNLTAFLKALRVRATSKKPTQKGKYGGWAYTNTTRQRGRISQLPILRLGSILVQYAGKPEFDPIMLKRKEQVEVDDKVEEVEVDDGLFYIGITPWEFAELIALKIVLGIEDEAESDEVRETEASERKMARWLQRRANRPEDGGDMNPSELSVVPSKRQKAQDNAQWDLGEVYYALLNKGKYLLGVWGKLSSQWIVTSKQKDYWEIRLSYRYANTFNKLDERVKSVVVARKGSVKESETTITTITPTKGAFRFMWECENRSRAWIYDAPEGEFEEEATRTDRLVYNSKDCIDQRRVQEVVSNLVTLPVPERPEKDWDEWFKVYGGRMVADKTKAGAPQDYHGPSFVEVSGGTIRKAGECTMHDWYNEWKKLPECNHSHISKVHIHKEWWDLKVDVKNWKCAKCGAFQELNPTEYLEMLHSQGKINPDGSTPTQVCDNCGSTKLYWKYTSAKARKDQAKAGIFCNICKTWGGECGHPGKYQRAKFVTSEDVRMPVLVPKLRRYIEQCIRDRRFVSPPRLVIQRKAGKFIGGKLGALQKLELEIEMAEESGSPEQFNLRERYAQMLEEEKGYAREWKIMHVFVPIDDEGQLIFDSRYLPWPTEGTRKGWAIHAQIYAKDLFLNELLEDFGGYVYEKSYTEDDSGMWHLESSTKTSAKEYVAEQKKAQLHKLADALR